MVKRLSPISVHEAGHVVAALNLGLNLNKAAIDSDGMHYTHVDQPKKHWATLGESSRSQMEDLVVYTIAGWAAEQVVLLHVSTGSDRDFNDAMENLKCLDLPSKWDDWEAYLEHLKCCAIAIIELHIADIKKVAIALSNNGTMSADQLRAVLSPPLPSS